MSDDIQILTDAELSLLRTRLTVNPNTLVDPAVARKLLTTAEYYRDAISMASGYLPKTVIAGQQAL